MQSLNCVQKSVKKYLNMFIIDNKILNTKISNTLQDATKKGKNETLSIKVSVIRCQLIIFVTNSPAKKKTQKTSKT